MLIFGRSVPSSVGVNSPTTSCSTIRHSRQKITTGPLMPFHGPITHQLCTHGNAASRDTPLLTQACANSGKRGLCTIVSG
jgi:hypothetical protein